MKVAIYPGSFDPITVGHMDIVERATVLFDKVIISVAETDMKNPLFSSEERLDLVSSIYADNEKIEVVAFKKKLTVDLARENNACAIIRGLRAVSDFEYEVQLSNLNRAMNPGIESIFLSPDEKYSFISSSIIKDIARHNGELKMFVNEYVEKKLREKVN